MRSHEMTEAEFLKSYDMTKYDRPSLTADVVALSIQDLPTDDPRNAFKPTLSVLLIKRGGHPFKGTWAFPGGFSNRNERIEDTAARELYEETGLRGQVLKHVGIYSDKGRDPRGWIVSSVYLAVVPKSEAMVRGGDDAVEAKWFSVAEVAKGKMRLAFDHAKIFKDALRLLRPVDQDELAFSFLPPHFTLSDLQYVHEILVGHELCRPSFRRKILPKVKVVKGKFENSGWHRPAAFYKKRKEVRE